MNRWITAFAIAALVATGAFAQEHGDHPHGQHGPMMSFVAMFGDKLALTEAQKTAIEAIQKQSRDDNAAFYESSRQLMDQVRAARQANDQARLDSLKPAMEANHAQMKSIHDAMLAKILPVLTADQRAQFEKIRAEHDAQKHDH